MIRDLISLYEVINKANRELFIHFRINITDALTISGLAYKLFINYYYNNEVIPIINNKQIYNDIKESYYGGITEVYRPYGENLYYYDVNSLYPYVSLNDMPGLVCEKLINYTTKYSQNLEDLFGFSIVKLKLKMIYIYLCYQLNLIEV